jgi:selenocysteine-specific elongation factor
VHVVATAGHVDHGKSTLVRALTGMEPDRWAEERRRGLTIDLGYAWTTLPSGGILAFVDVPGHGRFIGNMLAGIGPAPAVLFVVAADEGWRQQSDEHLAAIDALGLTHGLLTVTRCDLADPQPAMNQALARLGESSLRDVESVAVSGATLEGLAQLRFALDRLVSRLPQPDPTGDIRLWVDRSFSIRGSGVVVTGTLGSGHLRIGDELRLREQTVQVRGLQCLGQPASDVPAAARVAVNLRGTSLDKVGRGDALLTPGAWRMTTEIDVRLSRDVRDLPSEQLLHVGTAALPVHLRPLGGDTARLILRRELPLRSGDRGVLRMPSSLPARNRSSITGVFVLDPDPPALRLRGAARVRGADLESTSGTLDLAGEVERRGAVRRRDLVALGVAVEQVGTVHVVDEWLIARSQWARWSDTLQETVDDHVRRDPLSAGMPHEALRRALGLPDIGLLGPIVESVGWESSGGRVRRPGSFPSFGKAELALQSLEQRLASDAFDAPEQHDLAALGLGPKELAAAAGAGRILRLPQDIVLGSDAPSRALRVLARLPQPFTTSEARQALRTTRRVAVPLLEHLDQLGLTRRDGPSRHIVH